MAYLYLFIAILLEIVATSLIKASESFTKFTYGISGIICFSLCLYIFSLSLKQIPLSIAYSIWCGLGLVLTAVVGVIVWQETLNLFALIGMILIVIGVILLTVLG